MKQDNKEESKQITINKEEYELITRDEALTEILQIIRELKEKINDIY